MSRLPRIAGAASVVVGGLAVVVGGVVFYTVHSELAGQRLVVSDDAPFLAGDEVDGPYWA